MEQNSARRSSNDEHQVVANTMQHRLKRKGIQYDQGGTRYCDNRADFNQHFNAYRKCIRLYQELQYDEGGNAWCELVGQAERKVMWLLQRICEKNRYFLPQLLTHFKASTFLRGFNISNLTNNQTVFSDGHLITVFSGGHLIVDLGSKFGIYKGGGDAAVTREASRLAGASGELMACAISFDLVAVSWFVESAKANVAELTPLVDLQRENTAASYHHGPC